MIPLRFKLISLPLRIFFKLLYHQMAWTYDWVAATVSVGQWNTWVSSVLPFVQGRRILELGHGPGHLQAALYAQYGSPGGLGLVERSVDRQVYGLDRSPQMSRLAWFRLKREGRRPCLVNGLAQTLPFPAETFHTVLSTFPSDYLFHPQTLLEIWRVLAPGGAFIVLPLAWITGRRLSERLAAFLFDVTGEAPLFNDRSLDPLRKMGFEVRSEFLILPSSKVLIIEARKPFSVSSG